MTESYQDNMTLDEIAEYDREMADDAVKNSHKYTFFDKRHALLFLGACIRGTLEYLGIKNPEKLNDKMLERLQETKQIRVERRKHHKGFDAWRNGFYLYQRDVLVAFISEVMEEKGSPLLIRPTRDKYYVFTNARSQ